MRFATSFIINQLELLVADNCLDDTCAEHLLMEASKRLEELEERVITSQLEATACRISLENMEASLPKIKVGVAQDFSDWLCDRLRYDYEGPRDVDSTENFIDDMLEKYIWKLEAGK